MLIAVHLLYITINNNITEDITNEIWKEYVDKLKEISQITNEFTYKNTMLKLNNQNII